MLGSELLEQERMKKNEDRMAPGRTSDSEVWEHLNNADSWRLRMAQDFEWAWRTKLFKIFI